MLQVFLELEELDDKHLRPAVVHGRMKLEALGGTGTTTAEVIDVITIEDISVNDEVPAALPAGREELQPIMYTRRTQPETCELIKLNPSCFDFNRWGKPLSKATAAQSSFSLFTK